MSKRLLISSLVWLWITIVLLLLFIKESGPFHFLLPEHLILLVETSKLFFIAVLLPFFIADLNFASPGRTIKEGLAYVVIIFLLFLPLTILGSVLAELIWSVLALEYLLLLLIGGIVINLHLLGTKKGLNLWRWYYLFGALISVGLPLLYYLTNELYHKNLPGLLYLNPFWLIWQLDQADIFYQVWLIQIIIGLVLIFILAGINKRQVPAKFSGETGQIE